MVEDNDFAVGESFFDTIGANAARSTDRATRANIISSNEKAGRNVALENCLENSSRDFLENSIKRVLENKKRSLNDLKMRLKLRFK